eukprot:Selendium_serpulae@DN5933_c1_g1_i4.p1
MDEVIEDARPPTLPSTVYGSRRIANCDGAHSDNTRRLNICNTLCNEALEDRRIIAASPVERNATMPRNAPPSSRHKALRNCVFNLVTRGKAFSTARSAIRELSDDVEIEQ